MAKAANSGRIVSFEEITKFDREHDVIVCGFGGAGGAAAYEARKAGADVLVLERASQGGGSTAMSSCEMYLGGSGGTTLQKELGYSDTTENMIAYLSEAFGPYGDTERIRVYAEGAAEHFDWAESLGVTYKRAATMARDVVPLTDESLLYTGNERVYPFTEKSEPVPRGHVPSADGDFGGQIFMGALMEQVAKLGAEIVCDADVNALIQDGDGHVKGVVARVDGKNITIRANKGVILTMGGFVFNEDMMRKHIPFLNEVAAPYGNPWDRGTGILLGQAAGGNPINMSEAFLGLAFYPPAQLTYGIFVNQHGQRFVNEDSYLGRMAHYAAQQPGCRLYLFVQNEDYEPSLYLNRLPIVGTGETPAEAAEEAGLPVDIFEQTLASYNKHAAEGRDPLFHKAATWLKPINKPPYAIVSYSFEDLHSPVSDKVGPPMFTLGGLDVRTTGEVLTPDGNVIPGLYAAGRTVAGLPRTAKGYSSGMSVGDATFFGRQAGRQAASSH